MSNYESEMTLTQAKDLIRASLKDPSHFSLGSIDEVTKARAGFTKRTGMAILGWIDDDGVTTIISTRMIPAKLRELNRRTPDSKVFVFEGHMRNREYASLSTPQIKLTLASVLLHEHKYMIRAEGLGIQRRCRFTGLHDVNGYVA